MRTLIFFFISCISISIFGELTNVLQVGNCVVLDNVDDFSDEVIPEFGCGESRTTYIAISPTSEEIRNELYAITEEATDILDLLPLLYQARQERQSTSHQLSDDDEYSVDRIEELIAIGEELIARNEQFTGFEWRLEIQLGHASDDYPDGWIPVRLRVDKHRVFSWKYATWKPEEQVAFCYMGDVDAEQLLSEIARGSRIAIEIGRKRHSIDLIGNNQAVAEFARRVNLDLVAK